MLHVGLAGIEGPAEGPLLYCFVTAFVKNLFAFVVEALLIAEVAGGLRLSAVHALLILAAGKAAPLMLAMSLLGLSHHFQIVQLLS